MPTTPSADVDPYRIEHAVVHLLDLLGGEDLAGVCAAKTAGTAQRLRRATRVSFFSWLCCGLDMLAEQPVHVLPAVAGLKSDP